MSEAKEWMIRGATCWAIEDYPKGYIAGPPGQRVIEYSAYVKLQERVQVLTKALDTATKEVFTRYDKDSMQAQVDRADKAEARVKTLTEALKRIKTYNVVGFPFTTIESMRMIADQALGKEDE